MNLGFTVRILREGTAFVAHVPELDVSSCGDTEADARRNIVDAVQGFLETAKAQGTLIEILQESGYQFENGGWKEPELVGVEHMSVGLR
jgi:predicted RNase H-like HicB family nuclease